MKKITKNKLGASLIEVILYLGIAALALAMVFAYGWNVLSLSAKTTSMREALRAGEMVSEKIIFEIRNAKSVKKEDSTFGGAPAKLTLEGEIGDTVIEEVDGMVTIKRSSGSPITIHSDEMRIRNLVFENQNSSEDVVQYVGFSFDAEAYYEGKSERNEYEYSMPFRSGASLRSLN
jgi:hypothetical protein